MLQTPSKTTQTLLSPRIPRDNEHERYHPELEEELKECLFCLRRNAMMFDLEVDSDLIEQRIYERQALLCRYRYLLARARELGLHTILKKYHVQSIPTFFLIDRTNTLQARDAQIKQSQQYFFYLQVFDILF